MRCRSNTCKKCKVLIFFTYAPAVDVCLFIVKLCHDLKNCVMISNHHANLVEPILSQLVVTIRLTGYLKYKYTNISVIRIVKVIKTYNIFVIMNQKYVL